MLQVSYSQFYQINNGIFGCEIKSVAISGNNVFIGLYEKGLYLSSDNGNSWSKRDSGFFNRINNRIYSVVSDKDNIFVCSEKGLFLTTDSGESWEKVSNVYSHEWDRVTNVAIKGDSIYAIFYDKLYLSTNYGKNWISKPITCDVPEVGKFYGFKSIAIKGENIYLGKNDALIRVSLSGREVKNSGLRDSSITSIIVKDNNLFVGTRAGVFMSSDDGDNWV